jgi:putative tricarboxylic transport membrane protein
MEQILLGLNDAFTLNSIIYIVMGVTLGIVVGAIPGLGHITATAVVIPMTFVMGPLAAIALLLGISKGAQYGGSISAILLNAPGTPEAAATCFDGYPLAKAGKGEKALKIALYSSVFGDVFSDIVLIGVAAPIAMVSLKMGPPEMTMVIALALTVIAAFTGDSLLKGLTAASLGIFFSCVGMDPVSGTPRLTMGVLELEKGMPIVALFIGMLALPEIIAQIGQTGSAESGESISLRKDSPKADRTVSWSEFKSVIRTLFRSSLIGTGVGALPGLGVTIAAFLGYAAAKRASRNPETFGKGNIEGVAAAESANNAVIGANLIPLFTLGIPGNLGAALLIGAFMIHGVTPGPLMFQENGRLIYGIYGTLIIANFFNLIVGYFGLRFFARLLKVPNSIIFPVIVLFCITGVLISDLSLLAVGVMIGFTVLGYLLRKLKFSFITFIIGFILGPIFELSLRQSFIMSDNSPVIFLTRPISLVFLILTAVSIWRLGFGGKRPLMPRQSETERSSHVDHG